MRVSRIALYLTALVINVSAIGTTWGQNIGVAYFGLLSPHFPCAIGMKVFDGVPHPALATLYGTFGNDPTCLRTWFSTVGARPHTLEIHLSNEACRRNKRCDKDELLGKLSVKELNTRLIARNPEVLAKITRRVKEVQSLLAPFERGNGEYILSTGLEDNFSDDAFRVVLETIRGVWPHKIVRSPVGSPPASQRGAADYLEAHGASPTFESGTPCIANLDGQDMDFPHRKALTKNKVSWEGVQRFLAENRVRCRVTFLWSAPWQGIRSDTFAPPRDRELLVSDADATAIKSLLVP